MKFASNLFLFQRNLEQVRTYRSITEKIEEFRRTFGYSAEIKCFDLCVNRDKDKNREIHLCLLIQPTTIVDDKLCKTGEHYTFCDCDVNILEILSDLIDCKREFPNEDFDTIWETVEYGYEYDEEDNNADSEDNKGSNEIKKNTIETKSNVEERSREPKIITPER